MNVVKIDEGAYLNPEHIVAITDNTVQNKTAHKKTSISMINGLHVESGLRVEEFLSLLGTGSVRGDEKKEGEDE